MAPDDPTKHSIEILVSEVRAAREALHALVERSHLDRAFWRRDMLDLPGRPRLTVDQRERFRGQIAAWLPPQG